MKRVVWANICLVLVASGGVCADRSVTPAADQIPVSVDELVEVFQTNELRAEKLYVGKEFELAGHVARVVSARRGHGEQEDENRYVVEFQIKPLDLSRIAVQFYFDKAERDSLADLKPGQEVSIRGKCTRLSIYTGDYLTGGKDYVELPFRRCKVVTTK